MYVIVLARICFRYESLVMLLLYVLYIILMFFNSKIGNYVIRRVDELGLVCCRSPRPEVTSRPKAAYGETSPLLDSVDHEKSSLRKSESRESHAYSSLQTSTTLRDDEKPNDLTTSGVFQTSNKSHMSG